MGPSWPERSAFAYIRSFNGKGTAPESRALTRSWNRLGEPGRAGSTLELSQEGLLFAELIGERFRYPRKRRPSPLRKFGTHQAVKLPRPKGLCLPLGMRNSLSTRQSVPGTAGGRWAYMLAPSLVTWRTRCASRNHRTVYCPFSSPHMLYT